MDKRNELQEQFAQEFISQGFKGIMNLACRFGKIKTSLNCIDKNDTVLIVYPEKLIKDAWISDIKKFNFKGKKFDYSTFMSFKKVNKLYDILIIDEVHLISPAQMVHIANYIVNFNIKKVIGLTGTLALDTKENLLKGLKLPVLVEYPIDEAIADGVITDYRIEVLTTPLSTIKDIHVKWKGGEFDTSEKASFDYLTYKISSEQSPIKRKMLRLQRMSLIKKSHSKIDLTKKVLKESGNDRVLVFTGLIDVADGLGIDSYHSKSKDDSAALSFISGKTNKLAVVKQLNTGVTFKKLNKAIINFFDSNAENMAQKISRITCLEYDNKDKIANIVIICSDEEQEKIWLNKALSFFDQNKIKFIN